MRLARLDLTRYGKFTDHRIDFGPREPGRPDLHIVYGPNEAGKSTALSAFLDLLFGIETQSRYGFLHPYATMRIGAALELESGVRELVRIKRPQNSLLDDKGQVVAEGILLRDLGGIDRDPYRTMFSLDDETLEAGGKSILASKGDLGQLLFSASAGLADLSQTLADLRDEADGFYRFRARSGELLDLKNRLSALKTRKDEIDTLASTYAQSIESRDRAFAQYEEASGESRKIRTRIEEIQRHLNALPRLAALRNIRSELEPLADLPEAPGAWLQDLPALQKEDTELSTRQQGIGDDINRLSVEIAAIALDESALGMAERVDRLADSRARYVTAAKDLPERRLQRKEVDFEISGILRRLEREEEADPKSLLLGASAIGALRGLIEKRSGIEAALQTAQSELSEAEQRLAEARTKLKVAGGDPDIEQETSPGAIALTAAVTKARDADHAARQRMAEKSRTSLLEALAERMATLKPWHGEIEALAQMNAPEPADMESWKAALAETQKQIDRQSADVERLTNEQRRMKAQMEAIGAGLGLVDDGQAAAIRAAREEAWAAHRGQLDLASADVFESVLRRDDVAANARLRHSNDVAKLQQTKQSLAVTDADLAGARELVVAKMADAAKLREQIAAAVATMSPAMPLDMSLAQLKTWLDRREKALEIRASLRQVESDLREAETDAHAARDKISAALAIAGADHDPNASFDTLFATAQSAIEREANLRAVRGQIAERRRDVEKRQKDSAATADADQKWSAAWEAACSKCWLGAAGAGRDIATVGVILTEIASLGPAIEKQVSLADRIQKMEADQQAFTQEVDSIARELGGELRAGDVQGLADAINNRVRQARADQTTRTMKMQEIEALQRRRREAAAAIDANQKRRAEMTDLFGVASLNEVDARLRKIEEKTSLRKRRIEAERDIAEALGVASLPDAEAILDSADRSLLESERGALKARLDDQDQRAHDLFATWSKAKDQVEAVGGDDAVARIEQERRTILLEIEEKALRHFRLRAGIVAAEQALRVYRDRHRSAMMIRASEAFRIISRGAYAGLATQPGKDAEVLIGVGADGRSKIAADMSKGARFQLYLALRVAGYEEFARSRGSVPFIADDIMETFDDFRAEEAFRLFSEMAQVGQVIYLTHHRHLCDIAQRMYPDVKVHELTADAPH